MALAWRSMSTQAQRAARFLELHRPGEPLLLPNPWDAGSAKILASLGYEALATTSAGHAATTGALDGVITREQAIEHSATIVAATDLPVSADLENGFADEPDDVAETIAMALAAGLAGCSIEDYSGRPEDPIYDLELAAERIAAAAAVAHAGPVHLVITARAENHLRGRDNLDDTIARLQAYQEAGADVLYAPAITAVADIVRVLDSIELPLNVLALPGVPPVAELAGLGVSRISVGGGFAFAAIAGLVDAAKELREAGTYGYLERTAIGSSAARAAFTA
jgi:2-methylisocitrate lyase-like PEP mutase family enzyme